jgi:hypothetical protein
VKNVCNRRDAPPLQCELENAVSEVTIMKGGARVILGRQLRHLHRARMEIHRCLQAEKSILSPSFPSLRMMNIYIFICNICKHVNFKLDVPVCKHISGCDLSFSIVCDFAIRDTQNIVILFQFDNDQFHNDQFKNF